MEFNKHQKSNRAVIVNMEDIQRAIEMVLAHGGRVDFGRNKVYEVKNVIRIDLRIVEEE